MQNNNKTNLSECQDNERYLAINYMNFISIVNQHKSEDLLKFYVFLHSLATTNEFHMVGVYQKMPFSKIHKEFIEKCNVNCDKKKIVRLLDRLCSLGILRIYDKKFGYIMTINNHMDSINSLVEYVSKNEEEFQFHKHLNRKNEFYSTYGKYLFRKNMNEQTIDEIDDCPF